MANVRSTGICQGKESKRVCYFNAVGQRACPGWHEQDSIPENGICSPPPKPLDYQGFARKKWFELEVYSINLNPKWKLTVFRVSAYPYNRYS